MEITTFNRIASHLNRVEIVEMLEDAEKAFLKAAVKGYEGRRCYSEALSRMYEDMNIAVRQDFDAKNCSAWTELFNDFEYATVQLKMAMGVVVGDGTD